MNNWNTDNHTKKFTSSDNTRGMPSRKSSVESRGGTRRHKIETKITDSQATLNSARMESLVLQSRLEPEIHQKGEGEGEAEDGSQVAKKTETTEQTRQRSMAQSPKRKDQGSPKKIHIVSKSSSLGKDIHVIKMNSSISSQLQKNDTKSV